MKIQAILSSFIFAASSFAFAQEQKVETLAETLNLGANSTHGGMGAPVVKYTNVLGKRGSMMGGRGAWIVDHTYMLGGFGYGMTSDREVAGNNIDFSYGGILLGYSMWSDRLVHPVFMANLGWGNASSSARDNNDEPNIKSNMSVIEPEVLVETNLFKHARLAVGGSYRNITGVKDDNLSNKDFQGWALTSAVNFGAF